MVEIVQKVIQDFCLSVLALLGAGLAIHGVITITRRFFVRVKAIGLAICFSIAVAVAAMFGGSKTNELLQVIFPFVPQVQQIPTMPVSIPTNHVPIIAETSPRASATMPFRAAKWNVRGAWNDSFRYAFSGDWEFPYGMGHLDRVEVCSQGRIIPYYGSSNVIASVGVPLEIVSPIATFGCGPTDRNSYIFSWTNAVVGRVLHEDVANAETMDASIELFRNGDIAVTTNGVTELIPRIHPSDTDGDGIPDEIDPNPGVWDGDFFGPSDELSQSANMNAYCWVDVVVSNADAEVFFIGDGPSDLPDPHFMARVCATNRVTVLIGKGYVIQADEQIECIGVSDMSVEVVQTGASSLYVRWPVTVTFEDVAVPQMRGGDSPQGILRTMNITPDYLGGGFEWTSNHCCEISMSGLSFAWSCFGACGCGGCQALGRYVYEGYGLAVAGGSCGCSSQSVPMEESPTVGASFSEEALFYEDAYTNAPGEVVGRRVSTNASFTCTAYGGRYGGTLSLATANFDKLVKTGGDDLPTTSVRVAPYETCTWSAEYAPLSCSSGANDITATATFTETFSGNMTCVTAATTVVKLTLTPWVTRQGCDNRHHVGVRENIWCTAAPNVGQWGETGGGEIGQMMSSMNYKCPLTSDGSALNYEVGISHYNLDLTIFEPTGLVARLPMAKDFGVVTNHAGGAGMNLRIYVLPETVAFSGISMEEIPSLEGIHQGYFSNVYFNVVWYHTTEMLAGRWFKIDQNNFWNVDRAWMGGELPRELPDGTMTNDLTMGVWSDGLLVWNINWGWGELTSNQGDSPVKAMTTPYNQTFTFDEYGTLTISKFQNTVSRDTNNVIRLNGSVVVGEPLSEEEINEFGGNN